MKAETVAVITPQKIKPYTLFYPLFNQESYTEIPSEILEISFASVCSGLAAPRKTKSQLTYKDKWKHKRKIKNKYSPFFYKW